MNYDGKIFQYAAKVALNHKETGKKNLQKILQIKAFIRIYNSKGIIYLSGKDDQKKFEKIIQHLILICSILKNEYVSCLQFKTQFNQENSVALLMIP